MQKLNEEVCCALPPYQNSICTNMSNTDLKTLLHTQSYNTFLTCTLPFGVCLSWDYLRAPGSISERKARDAGTVYAKWTHKFHFLQVLSMQKWHTNCS